MVRRKETGAEYIERNATEVTLILGDMIEHLGTATQAWSQAVDAARRGDLDRALTNVVDVEINVEVLRIGRAELRSMMERAGNLLDLELPDDDEEVPTE